MTIDSSLTSKLIARITFNLFTAESNMNLTDQLELFVRGLQDLIQILDINYKECLFKSFVVMVT